MPRGNAALGPVAETVAHRDQRTRPRARRGVVRRRVRQAGRGPRQRVAPLPGSTRRPPRSGRRRPRRASRSAPWPAPDAQHSSPSSPSPDSGASRWPPAPLTERRRACLQRAQAPPHHPLPTPHPRPAHRGRGTDGPARARRKIERRTSNGCGRRTPACAPPSFCTKRPSGNRLSKTTPCPGTNRGAERARRGGTSTRLGPQSLARAAIKSRLRDRDEDPPVRRDRSRQAAPIGGPSVLWTVAVVRSEQPRRAVKLVVSKAASSGSLDG